MLMGWRGVLMGWRGVLMGCRGVLMGWRGVLIAINNLTTCALCSPTAFT